MPRYLKEIDDEYRYNPLGILDERNIAGLEEAGRRFMEATEALLDLADPTGHLKLEMWVGYHRPDGMIQDSQMEAAEQRNNASLCSHEGIGPATDMQCD